MEASTCTCQSEKFKKLEQIIAIHKDRPGALIPVMHEAQDLFGHLPYNVQAAIAEGLGVPLADVYGVATFYSNSPCRLKELIKSMSVWEQPVTLKARRLSWTK
jgi:NADH:ubiquinone oxidoreductase subunit E